MEVPQSRIDLPLSVKKRYGDFIAGFCPGLRHLSQTFPLTRQDPELLFALIESMQENTLESLVLTGYRDRDSRIGRSVAKHFLSLRHFKIQSCHSLDPGSIQSILFNCAGLEVFKILDSPVQLEDLVEKRWASTKIRELLVTINTGETWIPIEPNNRNGFDQHQQEKVARLEVLFRQLGDLRELKVLDVRPLSEARLGHYFGIDERTNAKFILSGLLTVGEEGEGGGLWGGLQFLSGIKNLTTLRGVFAADTSTMPGLSMKEKDVAWIVENWSNLERIEYFTGGCAANSPTVMSSIALLRSKLPQIEVHPFN